MHQLNVVNVAPLAIPETTFWNEKITKVDESTWNYAMRAIELGILNLTQLLK